MSQTKTHLVLGSGGVRTLAYVGAPNPLANRQAILDATTPLDRLSADKLVLELSELGRRIEQEIRFRPWM